MKNKIKIKSDLTEQEFMESILNQYHSGASLNCCLVCIGFYSLANSWHIDKFGYYANLLEEEGK